MRRRVKLLERLLGRGPGPFAHLSDEQLLEAIHNLQAGKPSGVEIFAGPPASRKTGLEWMSNDELLRRLEALRMQLVGNRRFGRPGEEHQ